MKKNVSYYLDDPQRLKDVSIEQLDEWIEEMPFHQPLRLLKKLKLEQGSSTSDDSSYAAYFAEDYQSPNRVEISSESSALQETEHSIEEKEETTETTMVEERTTIIKEIKHDLADETLEEDVELDIMEENPYTSAINEVSHRLSDDFSEDVVYDEVMESIEEESSSDESQPVSTTVSSNIDKNKVIEVEDEQEKQSNKSSSKSQAKIKNITEQYESAYLEKVGDIEKEDISESNEKVDKEDANELINDAASEVEKTNKKKKKKKKKEKPTKAEASKIKSVKGKITTVKEKETSKKSKAKISGKKDKKKKEKAKVVSLDRDNKISDFASWLLDHERVNPEKLEETASKKKKKKSKKKKKDKEIPAVAKKSIKESDLILSEPLADMYAQQGHFKKAKKMYKKLSLIFPEKSSYFAAKIEEINKNLE